MRAGLVSDLRDFLRGGGYLGMGMGGEGEVVDVGIVRSLGGGVEGREEKRLRPESDDAVMKAMSKD